MRRTALTALVALAVLAPARGASGQEEEQERAFGGLYATLDPKQRALVDDLARRFEKTTGKTADPQQLYDSARQSVRTTFDAVTHALLRVSLSDEGGAPRGSAFELIEHLEAVHGKARGTSSDRQFRIYVRMKPEALATLDRSVEFKRSADNTIFHKGYPLCYRLQGGVPSIQISLTPDGQRADVDVDYRSSKFPSALVNGHLTAANSDVRAGNNHDRHAQRWEGLRSWWRSLFGLALRSPDDDEGEARSAMDIPLVPRAGKKPIEDAVSDFLSAWLVERKPAEAMAYVSERALACLALERDPEAEPLDYGMAPVELLLVMQRLVDRLPRVGSLKEVAIGSRLLAPRLTLVRHRRHAQFVLYGVPDAVAREFECANRGKIETSARLRPRPGARLEDFSYFGTSLYLGTPEQRGATLLLLWQKEGGYWKMVSYEVEPESLEEGGLAEVYAPPETKPLPRVAGDPGLVEASTGFLEAWLVRKDYEGAFSYISRSCYPCSDLFRAPGTPAAGSAEAQADRLRRAMAAVGERVGTVSRLEDAIAGVEAVNPQIQLLTHPREAAFTLLGLADQLGEDADCQRRLEGATRRSAEGRERAYGTYYAAAFRIQTAAGEPAVLYLGWTRDADAWRLFAYDVQTP
jgi:hypothetical protein